MSSIQSKKLIEEVKKLSANELQDFVAQVLALRARYSAPVLSPDESALFSRINEVLPAEQRKQFLELSEKNRKATITPEEQSEFLMLIDEVENLDARRVQALGELALLRGVSLPEIMKQLGIVAPPVI